jgi:arabinofuranan 3-O-arabinosyltransferase
VCGDPLTLSAGPHRVSATPTASFAVTGLTLTPFRLSTPPTAAPSEPATATATAWGTTDRTVAVSGTQSGAVLLAVHENFNTGWAATADGQPLSAVRLDGWQQGWLVPRGVTTVQLSYRPDQVYRLGLIGAGVLLLLLVALAVVPGRRAVSGVGWRVEPRHRQQAVEVVAMVALGVVAGGLWFVVAAVAAAVLRWARGGRWLALLAACGVLVTAWPALPTVTAPGAIAEGWPARAATAGALVALAVVIVATVPRRRPDGSNGGAVS